MSNYEKKLKQAVDKQKHAGYYDVHISSPLLDENPQPQLRNEEKKSDNLTVRVPFYVRQMLNEIAKHEGVSLSQLINNAILNAIVKHYDREEARKIYLENIEEAENEPPRTTNELRQLLLDIQNERPSKGDSK